jgi:hypothetical protein
MYTPDRWVVFTLKNSEKTLYKVLGGWSGGYLDGDYWRVNSGIKSVEEDGDFYLFHGYSGSIYKCHKKRYGLTVTMSNVISPVQDSVVILGSDTNFLSLEIKDDEEI